MPREARYFRVDPQSHPHTHGMAPRPGGAQRALVGNAVKGQAAETPPRAHDLSHLVIFTVRNSGPKNRKNNRKNDRKRYDFNRKNDRKIGHTKKS